MYKDLSAIAESPGYWRCRKRLVSPYRLDLRPHPPLEAAASPPAPRTPSRRPPRTTPAPTPRRIPSPCSPSSSSIPSGSDDRSCCSLPSKSAARRGPVSGGWGSAGAWRGRHPPRRIWSRNCGWRMGKWRADGRKTRSPPPCSIRLCCARTCRSGRGSAGSRLRKQMHTSMGYVSGSKIGGVSPTRR